MPVVKLTDFHINKSYIDMPAHSNENNFSRSKTLNDCKKQLKIEKDNDFGLNDIPTKSSFHVFEILKKIGSGAYGRVFLVKSLFFNFKVYFFSGEK